MRDPPCSGIDPVQVVTVFHVTPRGAWYQPESAQGVKHPADAAAENIQREAVSEVQIIVKR